MTLTGRLAALTLKYTFNQSADQLVSWLDNRFTDHSQALPNALARANDRAWQAVGLALAGVGLLDRVRDLVRDRDLTALRDQIREFLNATPTGLEGSTDVVRVRACDELTQLRQKGRLNPTLDRDALKADLRRYGQASDLVRDTESAIAAVAEQIRHEAPHLAQVLTLRPPTSGTPLLALAFVFFFRREIGANAELARELTFDSLRSLTAAQDRGFSLIADRTAGILDQFDVLFDALGAWFSAADEKLDDIRVKLEKLLNDRDVTTSTAQPLRVSVTNEKELAQLRQWRDELRKLPPELLDAADWSKLGDALAGGRLLAEAREAHDAAAANAKALADRGAEAEAAYKAYRVACEQEHWDAALAELRRAADLDPARFAPFPFNRYEPVRILGAGGFGTVTLCRERLKKNREVAVKTLHAPDLGRDLDELFGEAHTVSELADPAIIQVYHWDFADREETRPYLVMEYFDGVSLAEYLKAHGPLPVADFIVIAQYVAEAMAAAHGANVIHRDLKPGNILVRRDSSGQWAVRVIDFGLAVRFSAVQASVSTSLPQRTRRDQSFAGTLEYASPEQKGLIAAAIGPRSDVYSFGKTMLETLLGTTELTARAWKAVPDDYRDTLQELLEGCVEKVPIHRHAGFAPIVAALAALDPAERKNRERQEQEAVEQKRQAEEAERKRVAEVEAARIVTEQRAREEAERQRLIAEQRAQAERKAREAAEVERRRRQEEEARWEAEQAARERAEAERKQAAAAEAARVAAQYQVKARKPGDTITLKLGDHKIVGFLGFGARIEDITITFAWCPPGTFRMGSERGNNDEKPVHSVTLTKGFFMGIHPVTQAQWKAVMGTDPSHFKGPNRPVEQVSWDDCQDFCGKLAKLTGKPIRLPTEAEWEYACRAGTITEFWFGDVIDTDKANYDGNYQWNGSPKGKYRQETTDVGSFPANPWGLYDTHGNVWEWCQDAWDEGFYAKSPNQDPVCTNEQTNARVLRGGSWNGRPDLCRAAYRNRFIRDYRFYVYGFRVCFRQD